MNQSFAGHIFHHLPPFSASHRHRSHWQSRRQNEERIPQPRATSMCWVGFHVPGKRLIVYSRCIPSGKQYSYGNYGKLQFLIGQPTLNGQCAIARLNCKVFLAGVYNALWQHDNQQGGFVNTSKMRGGYSGR